MFIEVFCIKDFFMQIQTEDILNAIGELETNAILVVDHEGIIRRMNKGVTAVLGYTETDLIGRKKAEKSGIF
jgi:PAS domain S-box-containing protein